MSDTVFDSDPLRKALFVPCETKEDLHRWIEVYLSIDMPDTVVDPESTSSPMDTIWEVYSKCKDNDDESFSRVMAYAARGAYKTLGAAILEVLMVLHLGRDVAHMAAIKAQAQKAQSYVHKFFRFPYLKDYVVIVNGERTDIVWYHNQKTGDCITQKQYESMTDVSRDWVENSRYIRIVVCTMQGANCVDPLAPVEMSDGTRKPAVDVQPGDLVRSWDMDGRKWTQCRVGSVSATQKQAMKIHFLGGGSLTLSEDHPVLTRLGWIRARNLRIGSRCLRSQAGAPPIEMNNTQMVLDADPLLGMDASSVILGSLLGDASLTWPRDRKGKKYGKGPRFQVSHCLAQYPYLLLKKAALDRLGIESKIWPPKKEGGAYKLMSRVCPGFSSLYNLLYPDDKKTISQELVDRLDIHAIACWFMDDGSGSGRSVGARKSKHTTLATCCFSGEEQVLLQGALSRYGWESYIGRASNGKNEYPILEMSLTTSRVFSAAIDPYIIPCLRYKLTTPFAFLDTRCIDCGAPIVEYNGVGFSRCPEHTKALKVSHRPKNREYASLFDLHVSKIEFIGVQSLVDVHIDTDREGLRNFVCNNVVLHNSEHTSFGVTDEIDVIPKQNQQAYEESKSIPDERDGKMAVTLLISTRKFSFGNVQKELDRATMTGLVVRHWNLIDVTERCPPTRHLPEEPRVPIWVCRDDISAISEEDYQKLDQGQMAKYEKVEGYSGCLKKCKIFAACRGHLATRQKDHPRDSRGDYTEFPRPMLKSIKFAINQFKTLTLDMAKAQLMCWQASRAGLIFSSLDREKHLLSPAQAAFRLAGEKVPDSFSFMELLEAMKMRDGRWVAGIDWGTTHPMAVVLMYVDGGRAFVVGRWMESGLDPSEKIDLLDRTVKEFNPKVFADTEAPDMIKFIKKYGYRCQDWKKGPGSVASGIDTIKYKLNPGIMADPQLVFVDGGPGIAEHFRAVSMYHWEVGLNGDTTDVPDETIDNTGDEKILDDEIDALRYAIMNTFGNRSGGVRAVADDDQVKLPTPNQVKTFQEQDRDQQRAWAAQIMEHVMGGQGGNVFGEESESIVSAGKKNGFHWDIG